MPSQYNLSLPTLTKDEKEAHVGHKHQEYDFAYQKASIKGCIAFFSATLENKDLDPELQRAAKCAVAEDEVRIETLDKIAERRRQKEEYESKQLHEEADRNRSKCVML